MVLVCLAGIGSGYGQFGDGVFVHKGKAAENTESNVLRSLCLDWAKLLVHICQYELVKGLVDLIDVYTVIPVSDFVPKCILLFV